MPEALGLQTKKCTSQTQGGKQQIDIGGVSVFIIYKWEHTHILCIRVKGIWVVMKCYTNYEQHSTNDVGEGYRTVKKDPILETCHANKVA